MLVACHRDKRKSHEETKETSNTGNLHHYYLDKRIIIITIWIKNLSSSQSVSRPKKLPSSQSVCGPKNYHHHNVDRVNDACFLVDVQNLSLWGVEEHIHHCYIFPGDNDGDDDGNNDHDDRDDHVDDHDNGNV